MYTIEPEPVDAIETDYNQFWRDIVETDGQLDPNKVKRELYDYHVVMREVSKVYDELTGGRISKPNTAAGFVVGAVIEHLSDTEPDETGDALATGGAVFEIAGESVFIPDADLEIIAEAYSWPHEWVVASRMKTERDYARKQVNSLYNRIAELEEAGDALAT